MRALTRLIPYFGPYRFQITAGLLLVLASSGLSAGVPWLLRIAIDEMRDGAPVAHIWRIAFAMVGLALVGGLARYGMREYLNGVSRRIEFDLRNDLFTHLASLDAAYFARTRTGDIMARLTNDLSAVRQAGGPAIMYLTNTITGGIFALVFMLGIDARLTGLALLPMLALPVVMARLGRAIHDRFEAVQEHFSTMTTLAQENISGVRIVRAYRQEGAEIERFKLLNDEYLTKNMHLAKLYGTMNPAFGLFAGLGMAVVIGVGGMLALRGEISVGSFVAFGFYLGMLTWPLIAFGWVINLFQRGGASMGRLNAILDTAPSVATETRAPRVLPPATSGRALEFRRVGFHYPVAEGHTPRWVLRDISFTVPAGATLGVVGATGSGKSALMDLIPRFYDPQEGEILLDGVPIRDLDLRALRREIGYVPQESLLFSDTIATNLAYGAEDPEAGPWAARVAQLDRTIADFPGGYETMLGERGINLSGGQKQRAALARALARRPAVVLLDDALSAVDTHTEAEILHGLRVALSGRTAVIASHRISAIRDATWTIVIEDGRIVEQGRHEQLLALGGRYWSLLSRQQLVDEIADEDEDGGETLAEPGPADKIGV